MPRVFATSVEDAVASFTADGAYDQGSVYANVTERHPDADVVVPPQLIAEKGRMGWQKATGYNARARAEAAISRYKRVIGDGLRSRTDRRRVTEHALNRMLELGRPNYVRIA